MHKFTKTFHSRSTFIATFVWNKERFAILVRNAVCMRSYFTSPRACETQARIVKLKQGIILNSECHYFEHKIVSVKSFFNG